MYGLKHESIIFRLRKPETKIGRHASNHVVISKSLKISRFHAVVLFSGGGLLIKDISEWGVFVNEKSICKHRWAKLKLGDMIALGALTKDESGRILEVVAWESEDDRCTTTEPRQIEVIDITDDDVIDISDDEIKNQNENRTSLPVPSADHVTKETTKTTFEMDVLSDDEEGFQSTLPVDIIIPSTSIETSATDKVVISSNENQISADTIKADTVPPIAHKIETDEIPPIADTIKADKIPLIDPVQPQFIDVTSSMNGLLVESPPFEYPNALQSILNYFSDNEDDNFISFDDSNNNLPVNEDVKCAQNDTQSCQSAEGTPDRKIKPADQIVEKMKVEFDPLNAKNFDEVPLDCPDPVKMEIPPNGRINAEPNSSNGYKSPLNVFSRFYNEIENSAESDDSSSASNMKPVTPIIHRTLLTNKIAKIAIISPLPNKSMIRRRRKRTGSESPELISQRVTNVEQAQRSLASPPPLPKSKNGPHKRRRTRWSEKTDEQKSLEAPLSLPQLKSSLYEGRKTRSSTLLSVIENKRPFRKCSVIPSAQSAIKEARGKVKALYPLPPSRLERTPETRTKPKVKVTAKNRGDFLTKLELKPAPCHRSPAKASQPKPDDAIPSEPPAPVAKPDEPVTDPEPPPEPTTPITPPQVEPESSPVTNDEPCRSIDDILNDIEVPAVAMDEDADEIVPSVTSARTIEVCVNFSKAPPPPPSKLPAKMIGESILKKPAMESQPSSEKKRVTFPQKVVSGYSTNNVDYSRLSFSTMMNKIWPAAECHNCGRNGHSTKRCTKDPVCYNCLRSGHIAINCSRPIICFNCKVEGHKENKCKLPVKEYCRDFDNKVNGKPMRKGNRDPRLRPLKNDMSDEST